MQENPGYRNDTKTDKPTWMEEENLEKSERERKKPERRQNREPEKPAKTIVIEDGIISHLFRRQDLFHGTIRILGTCSGEKTFYENQQ